MVKFKTNVNSILISILEIAVGILLMINPLGFTSGIIMILGSVLVVIGLICIINYFRSRPDEAALGQNLFKGILSMTAGVFCVVKSDWLIALFPLITMIYGLAVLLEGIFKIQWAANMIRLKKAKWLLPAIGAVLSIICAVIILSNPFGSTIVLWNFTAITLIVEGVFNFVILIAESSKRKSPDTDDEIDVECKERSDNR